MDLTLECIRRHYLGQASPLSETLTRYGDFFALFGDFRDYVQFFLVNDLVTNDYSASDSSAVRRVRAPSLDQKPSTGTSLPTRSSYSPTGRSGDTPT